MLELSSWFDLLWFIVFNATFSNISAKAGVPGRNHWTWASNW